MKERLLCLAFVMLLSAGCKKAEETVAVDAGAVTQVQPTEAEAGAATDAGPATTPPPTPRPKPTAADAGAGDAGSDAGGKEQTCCCSAPQHATEVVAMSECNTARKGQCVKAEQCEQTCCCAAAGHKNEVIPMADCNKTRKGQCVKADQCKAPQLHNLKR